MDDVRELVSYLSKAERGYTKTLNREFLKAGFDLSRAQYELLQVLWAEDHVGLCSGKCVRKISGIILWS